MAWTYTNVPAPDATVSANYNLFQIANGLNGRTLIVSISKTNMTNAHLRTVYANITQSNGSGGVLASNTGDAFTVAGFGTADGTAFESGVTDVVYFALQGTGTFDTTGAVAGVASCTAAVVAVFVANK